MRAWLAQIDTFYARQTAPALQEFDAQPDIDGNSLLDNTVAAYVTEVARASTTTRRNMPFLVFGGKNTRVKGGQFLKVTGGPLKSRRTITTIGNRPINDVWLALAPIFGVNLPAWARPTSGPGRYRAWCVDGVAAEAWAPPSRGSACPRWVVASTVPAPADAGLACVACGVDFPVSAKSRCLVPDPGLWRARWEPTHRPLPDGGRAADRQLNVERGADGMLRSTRERLIAIMAALSADRDVIARLLAPLQGTAAQPQAPSLIPTATAPSADYEVLKFSENLFRDWVLGRRRVRRGAGPGAAPAGRARGRA